MSKLTGTVKWFNNDKGFGFVSFDDEDPGRGRRCRVRPCRGGTRPQGEERGEGRLRLDARSGSLKGGAHRAPPFLLFG